MTRVALNLGLLAISIVAALGVAEVVLRAMGHQALYEIYSKPTQFWKYDPLLGWSHEPGARQPYVGPRPWPIEFQAEVEINSLGLRGPEIPPSDPNELRVLFLGDSMVAGFEVEHDQTFVARLGTLLTERVRRPVRTINAGVRGYGTDQYLLYYRERGRLLRPDVVVVFHSANDPVDNMTLHEMRRPFGKPALRPSAQGKLELVNSPVPHYSMCTEIHLDKSYQVEESDGLAARGLCAAQMALFDHSALFSLIAIAVPWDVELLKKLYYFGNPHSEQMETYGKREAGVDPSRALTLQVLRELAAEVHADGAEMLLISEPYGLIQLDLPAVESTGVRVESIDSLTGVDSLQVKWRHDSHYNPEGHRRVAEELAPAIEPLIASRLARAEGQP